MIDQIKHKDIRKLIDEIFFQVVNKIPEPYNNTNAFGIIIIIIKEDTFLKLFSLLLYVIFQFVQIMELQLKQYLMLIRI